MHCCWLLRRDFNSADSRTPWPKRLITYTSRCCFVFFCIFVNSKIKNVTWCCFKGRLCRQIKLINIKILLGKKKSFPSTLQSKKCIWSCCNAKEWGHFGLTWECCVGQLHLILLSKYKVMWLGYGNKRGLNVLNVIKSNHQQFLDLLNTIM